MKKPANVWPRQPFIGLALAAIAGVFIADHFPYSGAGLIALGSLGAVAFLRKSSRATYLFAASCFFTVHALRITHAPGLLLARELGDEMRAVTIHGFVASEPKISTRGLASFLLQTKSIERDGHEKPCEATVSARWPGEVRYGDEVRLFGVTTPVAGPRNPGEFDMRGYLARHDVRTAFIARYRENGRVLSHPGGNPILQIAHESRRRMDAALRRGLEDSPDQHSLISGIVLGLRDETPDEVEEQFQQTGTIHLFAVAGLHVGMVAYLLWTIARALRIPRRIAICLIVPGLFFYAAITGLNTASLRAATMAAVVLGGAFLDRRVLAGNSLAAAAVLLLAIDTQQLFTMGFQLSFAVVSTIILLADHIFRALVRWLRPDPFLPRALYGRLRRFVQASWQAVSRGASVSLAAWIGSLPLILPYFYLVTPVSLFANLAVVPIAFFVLAVGLMSLLAANVAPWLALVFNQANWSLAGAILAAVDLFAHLPASHFYLGEPHWPSGARTEITALDLGAGGCVHVRDRGSNWLIDAGSERDFRRLVRSYLRSRGVNRLDGLILTHGDASHIGATREVLTSFHPAEVIDTSAPDRSSAHRKLIAHFRQQQLVRRICAAADELQLGKDVRARVLFPPNDFRAANADDQALVLQLTISNRWRVLLLSDSGEATEQLLLARDENLRSDIIVKGQHHSGKSASSQFLDRVQPSAIIASSVPFPENERVKEDWEAGVTARGIKLFRQDQTGAVTLRFFQDHWEAKPYLQNETFRAVPR